MDNFLNILSVKLPSQPGERLVLGNLLGASLSWAIYSAAQQAKKLALVITPDIATSNQLEREFNYFNQQEAYPIPVLSFRDWETLPFDHFSPHADIISERLAILNQISQVNEGILLVSITTLMHPLPPQNYIATHSLLLKKGQKLNIEVFRNTLTKSGYRHVNQVMEHGEYAVRGSMMDIFPMGSQHPYRMDLLDDEIETLRTFDTETQRTLEKISEIRLLPAHEFPLTQESISHFRQAWRERFQGNPSEISFYQSISRGESAPGIEYYLPLFFSQVATLLNYIPLNALLISVSDIHAAAVRFWQEIEERYEQLRHDVTKPILSPSEIFIPVEKLFALFKQLPQCSVQSKPMTVQSGTLNLSMIPLPHLQTEPQSENPFHHLQAWLKITSARVLLTTDTAGRREVLENLLQKQGIQPKFFATWQAFMQNSAKIGILIAPFIQGFWTENPNLAVLTETELFGEQVKQTRLRNKRRHQQADALIRDLTELTIGSPVVHRDHGVGRYAGLQTLTTAGQEAEYLTLEYEGTSKLYVPISALHLISRYGGADSEQAPLHRLGSGRWEAAKRKAVQKIRDVAAELLHIYAQRAAKKGVVFAPPDEHYTAFAAAFPFEETIDQEQAIESVISDMTSERCMDRLICGDVGFGKTEVAMRAAFIAVQSGKQVAVLAPTTLLAEQHLHNFQDRFASWPFKIAAISRFRSGKEQTQILENLLNGQIDIVIGTHKLLQPNVKFRQLGLLIVDEEHRFGVHQKERIKAMRAEVDLLTLTATPIPRTLNMALANIRDLSIIATPPLRRLSVKTFVHEYEPALIREAVMREVMRGGQVYFLHNEVQTIERMAEELQNLLPEVKIAIAHGQMREKTLERIMVDFYHQRFHLLLSTTIIESGIDVPTANTILIHRADRFGLAQLHQLRGRVGRSHHQAYAYLLTPPDKILSADAKKRLEAIGALQELGSGFTLATHDLEIRGAGELLGEEQSGHIQEMGFALYMEMLEQAVQSIKEGKEFSLDEPLHAGVDIDLKISALIPETYLPDVHTRLVLYKRMTHAKSKNDLEELQVEMIDRFGLLPQPTKNLFHLAELRLQATPLSVKKIEAGKDWGSIEFMPNPAIHVARLIQLIQKQPQHYQLIGHEKLKFKVFEETAEAKIQQIKQLLVDLSPSH